MQVANACVQYSPLVPDGKRSTTNSLGPDSLLFWIQAVVRSKRVDQDLKLYDVTHAAKRSESSLSRFERHGLWPDDSVTVIDGYAQALGVTPVELWEAAVALLKQHLAGELTLGEFADEVAEAERRLAARDLPAKPKPRKRRRRSQDD